MLKRCCPVCGKMSQEKMRNISMVVPVDYHLPASYDVVSCQNCGMVYADTDAKKDDYTWYYSKCNFYGDDTKDDNSQRYNWISELLGKYIEKTSRILEIGSGNGRFVNSLKENGYGFIKATDPSEKSVDRILKLGINANIADVYTIATRDEIDKYDTIFLFEVLEHLLVPKDAILNITKMLKDNAIFFVSVPDYSTIINSNYEIANYFNLEHINYFSEVSMDNLMCQFGMQVIDKKRVGEDLILVYKKTGRAISFIKDLITQENIKKYFYKQEKKINDTQKIIEEILRTNEKIIIFGAGSYVMNLLATTKLKHCNIIGYIDNNSIKQGKEFQGYIIHSPEWLFDNENRTCTIVICSMLYADKIKKQLKEMNIKNKIILL